jgi:uroporphyrinogen-III synthase
MDDVMSSLLQGRTIALAEGRQLEELAEMLEKEGAATLRCPMVSILDAPDKTPVVAWLCDLLAGRYNLIVLFTGEGVRRLLGFAEREGIREAVIAALARSRILTRGPKPVKALKEIGIVPSCVAQSPTTDGVIAALKLENLRGQTVGVQFYSETNPPLVSFLESAGATVRSVLPYFYAPDSDAERATDLIKTLAKGEVDVLIFTSSPQVDRIFEVATERGLLPKLEEGLKNTKVAAVGPVLADHLREKSVQVHICPEQGFVMKNLVQQIKKMFAEK